MTRVRAAALRLRNLLKCVQIYQLCYRVKRKYRSFCEFVRENTANRVSGLMKRLDPYLMVFAFLRLTCALGVIPYEFNKERKSLDPPKSGRKWTLWFLVACILLPLRGFPLILTPVLFHSSQSVGTEINAIIYLGVLQLAALYPGVVYGLLMDASLLANLLRMDLDLDECFTRRHLDGETLLGQFLRKHKLGWMAYAAMYTSPGVGTILFAILGLALPECNFFLGHHICESEGSNSIWTWCYLSFLVLDASTLFWTLQIISVYAMIIFTVILGIRAILTHAKKRRLGPGEAKYWYAQLAVLISRLNNLTRSFTAPAGNVLLITAPVLCNCTAKLVLKDENLPLPIFLGVVYLGILTLFAGQCVLGTAEGIHRDSLHLLARCWHRKVVATGRRAKKMRRERKLRDRKPQRNQTCLPLAWEIGPYYRIDSKATLDHLNAVIEYSFNAMVLI